MGAREVSIRWVTGREDLGGALALRERVFCGEQGVPRSLELDGLDDLADHLLAVCVDTGEPVGTLRVLTGAHEAKIGRVAVARDWRGRGIASQMLASALSLACARECSRARLAAQLEATALYERAGFSVDSPPFEEAGIAHVWMSRRLAPAGPIGADVPPRMSSSSPRSRL